MIANINSYKSIDNPIFRIYCVTRLLLTAIFLTALFFDISHLFSIDNVDRFAFATFAIGLSASISSGITFSSESVSVQHVVAVLLIDIFAFTIMIDATGNINGGLTVLMATVVINGALILKKELPLLIAAIATIAILSIALSSPPSSSRSYSLFSAGTWGILFFTIALVLRLLGTQLRKSIAETKQQQAKIQELTEINKEIIEQLDIGLMVVGDDGMLKQLNPSAQKMFEIESTDFCHISHFLELGEAIKQWRKNPFFNTETVQTPSGGELIILLQLSSNERDILIRLEDKSLIDQRAHELKLASLGQLTASVAHEIRNPIGAISYAAELLQESENLAAEERLFVDIIQRHQLRINKIIENTLSLSKAERVEQTQIDLGPFLKSYMAERPPETDLTLDYIGSIKPIDFDPLQLKQILDNLIGNAVNYGAPPIALSVKQSNLRTIISVADRGEAIPSSKRAKIFEPFYTEHKDGHGLGLYICTELCKANKSRLDYIPTADNCSNFQLSIPLPKH